MMKNNYICDICKKNYEKRDAIRNGLYIDNGQHTKNYCEVCDRCIKKVAEFILKNLLPKQERIENETL